MERKEVSRPQSPPRRRPCKNRGMAEREAEVKFIGLVVVRNTKCYTFYMAKDWTKLYKKYKGMWVALDSDEETVLGFGVTVKEAVSKAKLKTTHMPFLTRVPTTLDAYIGA